MSRNQKLEGFILKKTPFGEADEIVSIFTQNLGKVRCLAKSSRLIKSRLRHGLLEWTFVMAAFSDTAKNLPKIYSPEIKKSFPHFRHDGRALGLAFYLTELILRFSPDHQKNLKIYQILHELFPMLDKWVKTSQTWNEGILTILVQCRFLDAVGILPEKFSSKFALDKAATELFERLKKMKFLFSLALEPETEASGAQQLLPVLHEFLEYHLERRILSLDIGKSLS